MPGRDNWFKRAFRAVVWSLMPRDLKGQRHRLSWLTALHYWYFQRVIGINRYVPWPVHWSSMMPQPGPKFVCRSPQTCPGIMPGIYIQNINGVEFGRNVWVGPGVKVLSASHNLEDYNLHDPADPIVIGDDCWLGANAIILPGVRLGNHVVVAAGAVVNQSFPEDDIVLAGVPANVVKELPSDKNPGDRA